MGAGHVKAAIAAVRSWVQPPCHDQKTLFLSALCSAVFPRSWGRGVLHMSHLESSNLQGLSSALWPVVSLYLSHYPLHKILLWWPKGILIFENRDVYLEGSLILCTDLYLGLKLPSFGFLTWLQYQSWDSSCGVGLKSHQKAVGYPNSICVTSVLTGISPG